jgi:hypothetical protein
VTINTGQSGARFAGTCDQFFSVGASTRLYNVTFLDNGGYGPTYKTADILNEGGTSVSRGNYGFFQFIPAEGLLSGGGWWEPYTTSLTNVTDNAYNTANVAGLLYVNLADTTPVTYWAFTNTMNGQDFYVRGGNSNVTLLYDATHLVTCSGKNINLGNVSGYLHFHVTGTNADQAWGAGSVAEVCPSAQSALASSETVTYSATPTFSINTRSSLITLTGNVTSFTLPAGLDGQEKTLMFCQNATGGYTVAAPINVRGFFAAGTTASKCSSQHFTYSAAQSGWLADSPGVTNQ